MSLSRLSVRFGRGGLHYTSDRLRLVHSGASVVSLLEQGAKRGEWGVES